MLYVILPAHHPVYTTITREKRVPDFITVRLANSLT